MVPIPDTLTQFIEANDLPDSFADSARGAYLPLLRQLPLDKSRTAPLLLGINGAQGTGKSTLAAFLAFIAREDQGLNVAVLSLDDFYLTRDERRQLARDVHPLFATRGVPGTHDIQWLSQCLDNLLHMGKGASTTLPCFDKASDDRCCEADWSIVRGPLDLVILEGWCIGSAAQETADLLEPVNDLERTEDGEGIWRTHANEKLKNLYEPLFNRIDLLLFLQAPSFSAIRRWRWEQEDRLSKQNPRQHSPPMKQLELVRFIQHFERLTRHNLAKLPRQADFLIQLDEAHQACRRSKL